MLVIRFIGEGLDFIGDRTVAIAFRSLPTGTARVDGYSIVRLCRSGFEMWKDGAATRAAYYNGGMGDDRIYAGSGNDFLVGGAGNDLLRGNSGADRFIGGAGNDRVIGGAGNDTFILNLATDGVDTVNLGGGHDTVTVTARR